MKRTQRRGLTWPTKHGQRSGAVKWLTIINDPVCYPSADQIDTHKNAISTLIYPYTMGDLPPTKSKVPYRSRAAQAYEKLVYIHAIRSPYCYHGSSEVIDFISKSSAVFIVKAVSGPYRY